MRRGSGGEEGMKEVGRGKYGLWGTWLSVNVKFPGFVHLAVVTKRILSHLGNGAGVFRA
jgi:hypothetical protein